VLALLGIDDTLNFHEISADRDLGIEVTTDIFKTYRSMAGESVILKLGFDRFRAKLDGAQRILDFMDAAADASGEAPGNVFGNALGAGKGVGMIDLFNIRSVTITLADKGVLPSTTKGGV
jgi:hypothetical protein